MFGRAIVPPSELSLLALLICIRSHCGPNWRAQQQQQHAATAAALHTNRPPSRHSFTPLLGCSFPLAALPPRCLRWKTFPIAFANSLYQNNFPDLIEHSSMDTDRRQWVGGGWVHQRRVLLSPLTPCLGAFADDARCENNPIPLPFGLNLINKLNSAALA